MSNKPTMLDVARRAAVSLGTVSNVLNGDVNVTPERRARVLEACSHLSYQRNQIATSLRSKKSKTIGLVVPDILNTFYATLVEKLENLASLDGYSTMIVTTGENAERAYSRIDLLNKRRVDGMIVIPPLEGSSQVETAVGVDMPCVIVDRIGQENAYPSVATNNTQAAYRGTKHLLELGHRHIALAVNSRHLWNTSERIDGFKRAMRGMKGRAVIRVVGMTVQEAEVSLNHFFTEPDRPTALLTSNNLITAGAIRALSKCNLRIPDEMSILAFDDFEWLEFLRPGISAIRQPVDKIAADSWKLITDQIDKLEISVPHVRADAQLIIRESTAAIVS